MKQNIRFSNCSTEGWYEIQSPKAFDKDMNYAKLLYSS